ncbi:vWA domain-containing protein [Ramlibacter humi]|nr:vWA domain-containing protein [Ramlibacter humi]
MTAALTPRFALVFLQAVAPLGLYGASWAQPALQAPAGTKAGSEVEVKLTGPAQPRDFLAIVAKGSREGFYDAYKHAGEGGSIRLTAPARAGAYEIRLMGARPPYPTLARASLQVEGAEASLEAPARVQAGKSLRVEWKGPGNARDFVTVVKAGSPQGRYGPFVYVKTGALELRAPDEQGDYEVRYLAGQSYATLASARLHVDPVDASLSAPAEVESGNPLQVQWQGPNNAGDYVTVVPKTAHEGASGNFAYTARGNPARLAAPLDAGDYELRYSTGQSHATLARAPLKVSPGRQPPGFLKVDAATLAADGAVEIILDASGSMLQRMGSKRRIDWARETLRKLTSTTLPRGIPFALRIYGRETDSCQTDLEMPLGPLDPAAVAAKMTALQVRNLARTPIGASLEKAADDLAAAKGPRLIVLLTDGEETCGGDAAAAIARLKKATPSTRVNIVGFAIDDRRLQATLRHWAQLADGSYHDAGDAAGLARAMEAAMRTGFEVTTPDGQRVGEGMTGGEALRLAPGDYQVRMQGRQEFRSVTVKAGQTTGVKL